MESILDTLLQLVNPRQLPSLFQASQAAELGDLLSQEDSKLRDLELYRTREEASCCRLDFLKLFFFVEVDLIGERMTGPTFGAMLIEV